MRFYILPAIILVASIASMIVVTPKVAKAPKVEQVASVEMVFLADGEYMVIESGK